MKARRRPKKVETLNTRTLYLALVIGAVFVGMVFITPLVRYDLLAPFAALGDPDTVFRTIFLLDAAVVVYFALTCLLHALRRREWTLALFVSSWVIAGLAIGLNLSPRRRAYRAELDFVGELRHRIDSIPLAQAIFDASKAGTVLIVVAGILCAGWAVGIFALRESRPKPGQPSSGRGILIAVLCVFPFALGAVVTLVALGGAPGQS